jgi:uroporphyrin-III C-methyltransferase/precorrin-2 dehydrogenase/sirohydrochlorin ferrochelatase/uroporphyrin-III C-methyltransferase
VVAGHHDINETFAERETKSVAPVACVYLVGAGPGDPELLTLKALRLLQQADVIVYDRLVGAEILDRIPPGVTRIYVGKRDGYHHMKQSDINELLVRTAQHGRCVVRLKGGDPFVFGRGSEETQYLARHGVPFEVVPGISAAMGCAAYAGIPLTHRNVARSVHFVTGHCSGEHPLDLDWNQLADPLTTLVIYMGLKHLPEISRQLVAAGRRPDTPAAVIENGTTRRQRRCVNTLASLPPEAERAAMQSPSLVIVGDVVGLAEDLDWFDSSECKGRPIALEGT